MKDILMKAIPTNRMNKKQNDQQAEWAEAE